MPLLIPIALFGSGALLGVGGTVAVSDTAKNVTTLALIGGAAYLAHKKGWI